MDSDCRHECGCASADCGSQVEQQKRLTPLLFDETLPSTTITYTYDSLYRLTDAVYSNGFEFHYTYDPVGNRLTQTTCAPDVPCGTTTYGYDAANRLTAVNTQAYTWDNNGNLLSDGTSTYAYDSQNRLKTLTQGGHTYGFVYNGQGDRLTQSVDGVVTRYSLDLEAGLTQVLSDGSYAYLYGVDRLAQVSSSEADYFLGDAPGSVRQLVDVSGTVTLAKNYEPYGTVMQSAGNGTSVYGFTGEVADATGLSYLRARYLSTNGRLISRDNWPGVSIAPTTLNAWIFVGDNPTNRKDPTGRCYVGSDWWSHILDYPIGGPCSAPASAKARSSLFWGQTTSEHSSSSLSFWGEPTPTLLPPSADQAPLYETARSEICPDYPYWCSDPRLPQTDGFIGGFAGSANAVTAAIGFVPVASGETIGYEVVYDFRHQERAAFTYVAANVTAGSCGSVSLTGYVGKASGFGESGILSYIGSSGSIAISVSPLSWLQGFVSANYPIDPVTGGIASEGVRSITYGGGVTAGAGSPVQLSFQRSEYAIVPDTLMKFNNGPAVSRNTVANRRWAADQMKLDLQATYKGLPPGVQTIFQEIDKWVNYR